MGSREEAARLILAGAVRVNGALADKPAKLVTAEAEVSLVGRGSPFVGRGGEKLAAALDRFGISPAGMTCFDVGCSTGGFTDCLLQRGAVRVYAVDVGYGQFDWRLRQDPRVILMERVNVRYLDASLISDPIDLIVIDVSFISLTLVLPAVVPCLAATGSVVTLVKPQFEVGKGQVGRGGIVRDDRLREGAVEKVVTCALGLSLELVDQFDSPVEGRKGNREILAWFRPGSSARSSAQHKKTLRDGEEGVLSRTESSTEMDRRR